jgi:hypothetical protein
MRAEQNSEFRNSFVKWFILPSDWGLVFLNDEDRVSVFIQTHLAYSFGLEILVHDEVFLAL